MRGRRCGRGRCWRASASQDEESAERSARADVASAETDLSTARWNLEQSRKLFAEGAIPERDVKTGEQAVSAAAARAAAAESRLRASTTTLRDTRVVAPISGTVEARIASPGEHLARGAPLLTLVRTDVLELAGTVPARAAAEVRAGQTVHFTAEGRGFNGRVARVSPTITPGSRTLTLYVQVPNPDGRIKGGSFAAGRVVSRTVPDAVVVPIAAVRDAPDGAGRYAWRMGKAGLERVKLGLGVVDEARGVAQVVSGLAAGDRWWWGTWARWARACR